MNEEKGKSIKVSKNQEQKFPEVQKEMRPMLRQL